MAHAARSGRVKGCIGTVFFDPPKFLRVPWPFTALNVILKHLHCLMPNADTIDIAILFWRTQEDSNL